MGCTSRSLGLIDLRLKQGRIDKCYQLTLRHLGIEIGIKSFDVAGHLTANLHVYNSIDRACGRNARLDRALSQRYGFIGN